jgi:hypothetical protein
MYYKMMQDEFSTIYECNVWGGGSGGGSSIASTGPTFLPWLRSFVAMEAARRRRPVQVCDIGCGDCQCFLHTYQNMEAHVGRYTGLDCVTGVVAANKARLCGHKDIRFPVHFEVCDFASDLENLIPTADIYVVKDVVQHWTVDETVALLTYLTSVKGAVIIMVNSCEQTGDYALGDEANRTRPRSLHRPLHSKFYPLSAFRAHHVLHYDDKEVSLMFGPSSA